MSHKSPLHALVGSNITSMCQNIDVDQIVLQWMKRPICEVASNVRGKLEMEATRWFGLSSASHRTSIGRAKSDSPTRKPLGLPVAYGLKIYRAVRYWPQLVHTPSSRLFLVLARLHRVDRPYRLRSGFRYRQAD